MYVVSYTRIIEISQRAPFYFPIYFNQAPSLFFLLKLAMQLSPYAIQVCLLGQPASLFLLVLTAYILLFWVQSGYVPYAGNKAKKCYWYRILNNPFSPSVPSSCEQKRHGFNISTWVRYPSVRFTVNENSWFELWFFFANTYVLLSVIPNSGEKYTVTNNTKMNLNSFSLNRR